MPPESSSPAAQFAPPDPPQSADRGARPGFAAGRERAWLARILILTGLVYCYSLRNQFVFDDDDMIVGNRYLGNWPFVWRSLVRDSQWFLNPLHSPAGSYYRPLLDLWLAVNFHLFGLNPIGWRVATIALHLIVVVMVYCVAARLFEDRDTGLFAAGLFALMPIHAESAIWPSAVSQPLCTAFMLAAFVSYLPDGGRQSVNRRHPLSLALFAAALLSHESAIVFPILIAAHAWLLQPDDGSHAAYKSHWADAGRSSATRAAIAAWPYAFETAAFLGVRYWVLGFFSAPNPLNAPSAFETLLTIPRAIAAYLAMLAIPWRTGPAHPLAIVRSVAAPEFYLPAIALAALCFAGWLAFRRDPQRRLYLFCAAWVAIGLAPALDLHTLGIQSAIQDRYLYLPSFGFCAIVADLAMRFARGSRRRAIAAEIAAAGTVAAFTTMLFFVQGYWHDELRLFGRAIEQFPDSALWHNRMGMALKARGDFANARREFAAAVRFDPNDGASRYDLGLADLRLGDPHAAEANLARAIEMFKYRQPAEYAELAFAADAAGGKSQSEAALAAAAKLPDGAVIAALARAQLLFRHGDPAGAKAATAPLLRNLPTDAETLIAIGAELAAEHRYAEALAPYRRAAAIAPHDPMLHVRIAAALRHLGCNREALHECALALADAPNDAGALALRAAIERGGIE
ncbi:MAG: glycosyltransferase family 39 protein [Candidatus Binataceae bacterium]